MQTSPSPVLDWRRPVWALVLVTASVLFSLAFACATPFAALCAVAACTLPRRDAYGVAGLAWAANQVIGFTCLHYPWTANCLGWSAAIGLSVLLCTLTARWVRQRMIHMAPAAAWVLAFLAAFTALEAALAASSLALGGIEDFTPSIVAQIFVMNAGAWMSFFALSWAGAFVGITPGALRRGETDIGQLPGAGATEVAREWSVAQG